MLLLIIAWVYVVLMMALAEATGAGGSLLAALGIVLFYGALPLAIVIYLMRAAARRRAWRLKDAARVAAGSPADAGTSAGSALEPDRGGHAAGDAVAPKREEP